MSSISRGQVDPVPILEAAERLVGTEPDPSAWNGTSPHARRFSRIMRFMQPVPSGRVAPEQGAMTTSFGAEIGRLDPGRRFDAVVLDYGTATRPGQDTDIPPLDAMIACAKAKAKDMHAGSGQQSFPFLSQSYEDPSAGTAAGNHHAVRRPGLDVLRPTPRAAFLRTIRGSGMPKGGR